MDHALTTPAENATARGFVIAGGTDRDRVFRRASRHSKRVRILRLAIPAGIGLCLLVIVLAHFLNPFRLLARLPADFGPLVISGTKITMEAPRLAGFTRDSRAYEMSASAAAQDLTKPNLVELKELRAKLSMQDDGKIEMSALRGLYDTKSELLTLKDNIFLSTSSGYEGRLSEAVIDVRKGNVVSNKPVEVKMLKGVLNANGLEVTEAGDLIRFGGGVAMTLILEPGDLPGKQDAK
jgi:lipopolysaccharide export system protein LptC